jgi:hypothetical protein
MNNKNNVLLDKLKKIMYLKEDPDLPSIRQCIPIFGFHFSRRSQHTFCHIQVCHLGQLLQLHWIFTTHTMSKTIPIYQNMTSLKKLNARIRVKHVTWKTDSVCRKWMCVDMCMLKEFHTWKTKNRKWHVPFNFNSFWGHTVKCEAERQSQEHIFTFQIFLYMKCRHFPIQTWL